jgi:SAM-dependent methyltransferase
MQHPEWFSTWFDSPYYHILYNDRDHDEAREFILNILSKFKVKNQAHILDLACGKGRHSLFLHQMGFQVTGLDLSPQSIAHAKLYSEQGLNFEVGDMRHWRNLNHFDYILNLFTSFGYFDTDEENVQVLQSVADNLKSDGYLVLDYLNAFKTIKNLNRTEVKRVEDIDFIISREVKNGFIVKSIRFYDHEIEYFFQEKVKVLYLNDFEHFATLAGLRIVYCYGNYHLDGFQPESSDRLIMIMAKE